MAIKENDFVELDYTGKLADGTVFDTTNENLGRSLTSARSVFRPVIICVGEGQVVAGLDQALLGKEVGKTYSIGVAADLAFGKKDPKLVGLVPFALFKKQRVMPTPGLLIDVDGTRATVVRMTGGRVMVDFNHPLAGKDVVYDILVKRQVTDAAEKVRSYLDIILSVSKEVAVAESKATITLGTSLPSEMITDLTTRLLRITGLTVEFVVA